MTQHTHGNGDTHRANPDPVERRDRDLGRAEFRDPEKRFDEFRSSRYDEEDRARDRLERTGAVAPGQRDPDDIEREIERTRADMDDTLHALERKLSPRLLMDQAKDYLRSGPGGAAAIGATAALLAGVVVGGVATGAVRLASGLGSAVRHHPVPGALAAVGLGWLTFAGGRNGERVRTRRVTRYHYGDVYAGSSYGANPYAEGRYGGTGLAEEGRYGAGYGATGSTASAASASPGAYTAPESYAAHGESGWDRARESASDARERAAGMAHDARERTADMAHGMRDRASEMAHEMRDRTSSAVASARHQAGRLGETARHSATRTREGFGYMLNEHPIALGAIGVAVGACLGACFRSTRREREWFGDTRDEVIDRAREMGRDEVRRVRRVVESATHAAQDAAEEEADRQGMTREKDAVKSAAQAASGGAMSDAGKPGSAAKGGKSAAEPKPTTSTSGTGGKL